MNASFSSSSCVVISFEKDEDGTFNMESEWDNGPKYSDMLPTIELLRSCDDTEEARLHLTSIQRFDNADLMGGLHWYDLLDALAMTYSLAVRVCDIALFRQVNVFMAKLFDDGFSSGSVQCAAETALQYFSLIEHGDGSTAFSSLASSSLSASASSASSSSSASTTDPSQRAPIWLGDLPRLQLAALKAMFYNLSASSTGLVHLQVNTLDRLVLAFLELICGTDSNSCLYIDAEWFGGQHGDSGSHAHSLSTAINFLPPPSLANFEAASMRESATTSASAPCVSSAEEPPSEKSHAAIGCPSSLLTAPAASTASSNLTCAARNSLDGKDQMGNGVWSKSSPFAWMNLWFSIGALRGHVLAYMLATGLLEALLLRSSNLLTKVRALEGEGAGEVGDGKLGGAMPTRVAAGGHGHSKPDAPDGHLQLSCSLYHCLHVLALISSFNEGLSLLVEVGHSRYTDAEEFSIPSSSKRVAEDPANEGKAPHSTPHASSMASFQCDHLLASLLCSTFTPNLSYEVSTELERRELALLLRASLNNKRRLFQILPPSTTAISSAATAHNGGGISSSMPAGGCAPANAVKRLEPSSSFRDPPKFCIPAGIVDAERIRTLSIPPASGGSPEGSSAPCTYLLSPAPRSSLHSAFGSLWDGLEWLSLSAAGSFSPPTQERRSHQRVMTYLRHTSAYILARAALSSEVGGAVR